MNRSQKKIVLLVDDDAISRELLGLLLEAEGFAVHVSESGNEALDLLNLGKANPPDVVLTDLHMPGIQGPELARALRSASPSQTLLIGMSATWAEERLAALFDAFLLKPFTVEELRATFMRARMRAEEPSAQSSVRSSGQSNELGDGLRILAESAENDGAEDALDRFIHAKLAASMSPVQLKELYEFCLSDARDRIARMRSSAKSGDAIAFRKEAHAIKGSCSMLGAREMARLASAMETDEGAAWSSSEAIAQTDKFMMACERLESIL